MSNSQLWVEQYRPTTVEDLAMSDENGNMVKRWLASGEIPHVLLLGPPGVGKTTLAHILIDRLDCEELVLNASNERGIDTIRNDVKSFAQAAMRHVEWKIIFLDEADQLTTPAQQALRNMMEEHHGSTRFILTGNKQHKVEDAIKSRCTPLQLSEIPQKRRAQILTRILQEEGEEFDPERVISYAQNFTDMRQMIMQAQKSILGNGHLVSVDRLIVSGEDMLQACIDQNWEKVKSVAEDPSTDYESILKAMFEAVPMGEDYSFDLKIILGDAVEKCGNVPDPVIMFKSTCAKVLKGAS